jgi:hypothetical protein
MDGRHASLFSVPDIERGWKRGEGGRGGGGMERRVVNKGAGFRE